MIAHAGANLLSDYFDFETQVDRKGTFGSSGLLLEKKMHPGEILRGGLFALLIACAIGLYFVFVTPKGTFLLWLMLIGGIFAVFYAAAPIAFKYRALGDIAVFVSFGSPMVLGSYYIQAHRFSWGPVLYALPIALLVDAILHSNNLRDIQSDRAVSIRTIPILIGEGSSKIMYYALVLGAYLLTVFLIVWAGLSVFSLLTLLSLPLAIRLVKRVRNKDKIPAEEFAMIDAATAQFHLVFGILMIVSLLLHFYLKP
jgi:1,4-dihydroxy-2-naphthoate octaprenyltransferase